MSCHCANCGGPKYPERVAGNENRGLVGGSFVGTLPGSGATALRVGVPGFGWRLTFVQQTNAQECVIFLEDPAGGAREYTRCFPGESFAVPRGFLELFVRSSTTDAGTGFAIHVFGECDAYPRSNGVIGLLQMLHMEKHAETVDAVPAVRAVVPGGFTFTIPANGAGVWKIHFTLTLESAAHSGLVTVDIRNNGVVLTSGETNVVAVPALSAAPIAINFVATLAVADVITIEWIVGAGVAPNGHFRDASLLRIAV